MKRYRGEIIACAALCLCLAGFAWAHDIAQHVVPQLGVACVILGAVALWRRLLVAGSAWIVVGIVLLLPVFPEYMPREHRVGDGCRITVLTFNQEENPPDNQAAARLIASLHPDILFAQKVYDPEGLRSAIAAAGLAGYDAFLSSEANKQIIMSRYRIANSSDDLAGISVDATIAGQAVRLFGLSAPRTVWVGDRPQQAYYAALLPKLDAWHGPLILAGDANTSPFTPEMKAIRQRVQDAWDEAGYGLGATFPGPWRRMGLFGPFVRIDDIFHDRSFTAAAARRSDDAAGAGHYPVLVELVFLGHGDTNARCR